MIDWVNAVMPYPHNAPILGGACVYLSPEKAGEHCQPLETPHGVMYATGISQKKAIVRGSYDSKIAIQSSRDHAGLNQIWISGSPKPLQGHNLFGTDDPRVLAAGLARFALESFGLTVDPFTWRGWLRGERVKFTRIDVTQMLDVGSEHDAAQWLRAVSEFATVKHRGRGRETHGTVYFGKGDPSKGTGTSRRSVLKLYRKYTELISPSKQHRLPESIPYFEQLLDYARGTVRAEWTLQSQELKRLHLQDGRMWESVKGADVWSPLMEKLELPGNFVLDRFDVEKLPRGARTAYLLWQNGTDMRQALGRSQFYQHRSVLKRYGIDIATPPNRRGIVKPLIRVVEARPKQIPSWAQNTPLLYAA